MTIIHSFSDFSLPGHSAVSPEASVSLAKAGCVQASIPEEPNLPNNAGNLLPNLPITRPLCLWGRPCSRKGWLAVIQQNVEDNPTMMLPHFFRFLNILNSAKSCETRICNYCNDNMYTYCSDVIVCSLDNTSHGACPAMAGRHQELHHGTGAMATGPDWRRGQAPKAWRLTEVQRGIPEVFKLNL